MPPSAFFIGGVLRAGGLGGCGIAGSALPSVSGAFGALAKSRELAFGSDSPAFYAALASVALSETVGGLPLQFPRLVRPPGLLSFFKLVYCHCSFVALGGKMPPSAFFIGGVLKAGGRGVCGIAGFVLPSVSGAFGALAKSRELAFGSDSPAFYAALASVALSETIGGLPLQSPRLVRPPGLLSFFRLVYCHCSFVALGGKMPPSAFFIGGVLKAGGLGGCGIAGSALPSVSGALRALAKSRELAFGSDSPAFYAALPSVALSETVGGLPLQSLRLVRPPGLLSFFKLVYCHCSFVALGGMVRPSGLVIGEVVKAGGRGSWGSAGYALLTVSGALRALAISRELAFGSDSPAFYAALASVALSETVGGLPCSPSALCDLPGCFLFSSWFIATAVLSRWAEGFRHRYFMRKSFASGCKVLSCEGTEVPLAL